MSKIRVLATEDDTIHEEKLRMVMDILGYELIDVISNPNQLLTKISATQPDVLLIDIDLGEGISGIELVKKVNEIHDIPTVYITSFVDNETFQEAKKTLPAAYLTKPYKAEDLNRAIELAVLTSQNSSNNFLQQKNSSKTRNHLFIKNGNTLSKLVVSDIKLIEAYDKYCYIYTSDDKYMLKERLKNILSKLSPGLFCQVHRSFVVNFEAIETIELKKNKLVVLGKSISIGKTYKQNLLSRVNSLG